MSEKPILFSGLMVRAILDGRKTQTRRVVKIQPPEDVGEIVTGRYHPVIIDRDGVEQPGRETFGAYDYDGRWGCRCPWEPGDLLYVRETWSPVPWSDGNGNDTTKVLYRATDPHGGNWRPKEGDRWRPSIHMPKWAARTWLRVTDVRVERLQEITEADAKREGFADTETVDRSLEGKRLTADLTFGAMTVWASASGNFETLWDALNAKRGYGWDVNPWVWVVTFERTEAPQ